MVPTLVALRALGLGDLLVAVPALRALRRAFPRHRRLLATPGWLHPLVDLVGGWRPVPMPDLHSSWPASLGRVDVAVNLHGNGAASARLLDELAPRRRIGHGGHGWPGPRWRPELRERLRWCRLLAEHGIDADDTDLRLARPRCTTAPGVVLVHPGAAFGAKRWPPDRFARVAAVLHDAGHRVVITGNVVERALGTEVAALAGLAEDAVLAGRTELTELAALVAGAGLVVSGDTGIAHLATAFDTPAVTLYGPVVADRWGPPAGASHRSLQARWLRRGDPFAADPDPALLGVTVPEVLRACGELLTPGGRRFESGANGKPGAMPTRDEMPSTIERSDDKAQRTWTKTHDSAVQTYGEGERAHRTAFAALKHTHEKQGDHWVPKQRNGPSDAQAERGAADQDVPTKGGVDANASKRHLMDVARRLDVKGRSSMTKDELADAIDKANRRETARARRNS